MGVFSSLMFFGFFLLLPFCLSVIETRTALTVDCFCPTAFVCVLTFVYQYLCGAIHNYLVFIRQEEKKR